MAANMPFTESNPLDLTQKGESNAVVSQFDTDGTQQKGYRCLNTDRRW